MVNNVSLHIDPMFPSVKRMGIVFTETVMAQTSEVAIVGYDDDVSLLRIINTPARGISANTVESATEFSARQQCSVFEALRSPVFRETLMKRASEAIDCTS